MAENKTIVDETTGEVITTTTKTPKEDDFERTIREYLEREASADPLFAISFAKEYKNIKECCQYIKGEARKKASNNCAVMADADVYNLAKDYYDEDDIKITPVNAKVATSKPKVASKEAKVATETKVIPLNPKPKKPAKVDNSLDMFADFFK